MSSYPTDSSSEQTERAHLKCGRVEGREERVKKLCGVEDV